MKSLVKKLSLLLTFVFLSSLFSSESKAAIPNGMATVSVTPESGIYSVGDGINMDINFDTHGETISGIAVQLVYPYSGSTPELSIQKIIITPRISEDDWTCPTQYFRTEGNNVIIDVGCANTSALGYTSVGETNLATISFLANRVPATNPLVIRFDPANSVITRKSDNQDILAIPESAATYIIGEITPTPTFTPTPTPTLSPTLTPTPSPSPTAQSASLTFDTSEKGVTKGDVFKVEIYVDAQNGTTGIDAFINFDKDSIKLVGTDDLNGDMGGVYNREGGVVIVQRYFEQLVGRTKIATLVFEPIKKGSSEITFVNDGSSDTSKVYNGQIGDILTEVNSAEIKVAGKPDFKSIIKVLIRKH